MRTVIAALVMAMAPAYPAAAQILEMNGSWELAPAKSIGPSPVQETLVFEISHGIQRYRMTSVDGDGDAGLTEWEIQYDGKDHATRTEGNTASIRRIGEKTEFVVNKSNGRITSTYTRVLVDDDRTIMSIGRNAEGEIQWVRVFEKQ
jgi:hypothetical protein